MLDSWACLVVARFATVPPDPRGGVERRSSEKQAMRNFLAGFLTGALTLFVAMCFHVVRAKDGFHVIPKVTASLKDPYVDIREFGFSDWQEHPELSAAIAKAEKSDILKDSAGDSIHRSIDDLFHRNNGK